MKPKLKTLLHEFYEEASKSYKDNPQDDSKEAIDRYNAILDKHTTSIWNTIINWFKTQLDIWQR